MDTGSKRPPRRYSEGLLSAVSIGFFLILLGAFFIITPGFYDKAKTFFLDFKIVNVTNLQPVMLPAPASPSTHVEIYTVAQQFCLIWGIFQIILLLLRFAGHSPFGKKVENVSDIVFWLGAWYLVYTFLNSATTVTIWFTFWSTIIMLLGFSLIVRAAILAVAGRRV